MDGIKRLGRSLVAGAMFAALCAIAGVAPANASGYWTCSGSVWVAVGTPDHAMPLKSCGTRLSLPETQVLCDQAGGVWGPAGLSRRPLCTLPTHDAGQPCSDNDECEGRCLAPLTPAERELIIRQHKTLAKLGACTPHVPVYGCMAIVRQGFVSGLMCLD